MSAVSILLNLTKSLSNGVWRRRSTRGTYLPFLTMDGEGNPGLALTGGSGHGV
jgi:hypothetical protein